ncbi:flagellar hook-basal body complex protein, partial [Bradyrhizobium sp.]|uniref:flagellar hook-basal body complex protein n=1 Tax=Bradyrhizobium sp. TaxID=376 RepID=UPI003C773E81
MGIFDALNTSVSGLQAQSFALQNISGNIANSSTVGFKATGTSFQDLVPQSSSPEHQAAGGVAARAQASITTQGTVSATAVATNMAISGAGFFNVQKPIGIVDNVPVFDGITDYTRRGDFQLNANGNLVNGAGYYLLGVTVDPVTGNPIGNVPQVLQFQNNFIPAKATTKITYAANLPTKPATVASSTANLGTLTALGGLNPADFTPGFNPQIIGTPATPFADATTTGSAVNNKAAIPAAISGTTLLSGVAGTNSITSNFAAGDTITVDGTVVTFVAAGAVGNQLNVTDNVTTLLAKIDSITGTANPSTVGGGAITLHTGTTQNLTVTSTNASAFGALGFPATVT